MPRQSVYFTAPKEVAVHEEPIPELLPGELMVETILSGISPGTECLVYRGQFPNHSRIDSTIGALSGRFEYPLAYGYSVVGRVVDTGKDIDRGWIDRLVFAFQPHTSHFCAQPGELIPIPPDISPDQAVFLSNMETAVNFLMDGRPMIGEEVIVCGQGVVGLLTTALLAQFPLSSLVTLDYYPMRRETSLELGAHACLDPGAPEITSQLKERLPNGADLAYELSGEPQALEQLLAWMGFDSRLIIGSWYGQKRASLDLGGDFHRNRIRLVSSQVSTLAPEHLGRWTKDRRFGVAWEMIRKIKPESFITHRIPLSKAAQAYQLLDQSAGDTIQIVLVYLPEQ